MINPLHSLTRWFAPYECLGCSAEGALLCTWCRSDLPHVTSSCYRCDSLSPGAATCQACRTTTQLSAVYRRTFYETDLIKQFIWRFKFDRAQNAAQEIAEMLAPLIKGMPADVLITYAPTAPARIRKRGYDQSELIARHLARLAGRQYISTLFRVGKTDQIGATRTTRQAQAAISFAVKNQSKVHNRSFLVIDDVMTTGATLEAAATALSQAGATDVKAAIFAYTPPQAGQLAPKLL